MYRTSNNAVVGGLCAAIGDKLGINRNYIRIFFIIGTVATGFVPGILIYLALCAIIPKSGAQLYKQSTINKVNNKYEFNEAKIKEMVQQINKLSNGILDKQKSNPIVERIVKEFKSKIIEFQKYSPKLEKQYLSCVKYLKENDIECVKATIDSLKEKIELSSGSVQSNYQKVLEQNQQRLKLYDELKEYIDILESKLHLILSTLQNIDASILNSELQAHNVDNNYDSLQSQISVLTESITEMSDIYKKNKIRV